MGLLDDAIREHLDLKRRRGADPAEVERAEREALGPVRRNRDAPTIAEVDEEPTAGGLAYDQADDSAWAYDDADVSGPDTSEELSVPPLKFTERERDLPGSRLTAAEDPLHDDAFDEPAFGDSAFAGPDSASGDRGETTEFDVERAIADDRGSDEDVLEETPEFLSDTPDHDRLWFEQRPPKDFDFDG